MADKDKIAELLRDVEAKGFWRYSNGDDGHDMTAEDIADYLTENGVTIQRWIPVTERLPENDEPYEEYLVNIVEDHFPVSIWDDDPYCQERVTVAQFDDKQKLWYLHRGNTALNALILPEDSRVNSQCVTHWMPLPEPPKEESK